MTVFTWTEVHTCRVEKRGKKIVGKVNVWQSPSGEWRADAWLGSSQGADSVRTLSGPEKSALLAEAMLWIEKGGP